METKGIITTVVGLIFAVLAVQGLMRAADGYAEMIEGRQIENPQLKSRGEKALLFGLLQAGGMGGFATAIIAAINALNF